LETKKKYLFICNQHFDVSSYRTSILANPDRMYLKQDAIPSIVEVKLYNTNSNINIESTMKNSSCIILMKEMKSMRNH